jgi:phenylacetic acid degradation operon negative regulatory protein
LSIDMDKLCNTFESADVSDPDPARRLVGRVAALDLPPLSARSVVLSALLGTHPPVMPVAALVALTGRFGISPGTTRTALSRMVGSGDLTSADGRYRLAGRLLERQREQDVGRRRADTDWDGSWWVVSTLGTRRSAPERRRFRTAMEGAKLGELRPDTWMRPANLPIAVDVPDVVVSRGVVPHDTGTRLVGELWDLATTEAQATELVSALDLVDDALGDTATAVDDAIAPAFTVLAACLRFLRVEPQLPDALAATPAGDRLRHRYAITETAVRAALRDVYRTATDDAGAT